MVAPPLLKICGLRQSTQAAAIAALGVDAIGVIGVEASPRFVPAAERGALFAAVQAARPTCLGVLVVADPGDAELPQLAAGQGHRVLQLHGDESPERCRQLRHALDPDGSGLQLWKALRIRDAADLERVSAFSGSVDAVLLDAWTAGALGGTGQRIPLAWLQRFAPPMPWWLAGGIGPANAAAVLTSLRPAGLDASSALEIAPGVKDLTLVRELLAVVQMARQDQGE